MKRILPIFVVGALVSIGTFWSFGRGGHDFAVFYEAWNLVAHGRGTEIYTTSPDRFLYAPGFAWILSPLGLLPQNVALAIWNLAKATIVYFLIQAIGKKILEESAGTGKRIVLEDALAIAAGGFVLLARPLLIDFQYGQVNLFILAGSVWALLTFFSKTPARNRIAISWFVLGVVSVSKLFALPLLLLPWVRPRRGVSGPAKFGSALGFLVAAILPILTLGVGGGLNLILAWRAALAAKGLPFESHNQSFIALLDHYFTTDPTHIIALGWKWIVLGLPLLSMPTIVELSLAWSFLFIGVLLAWIFRGSVTSSLRWIAVAMALLFVPSYLVWKPYFILGYPLAALLIWQYGASKKWLIVIGFLLMNLTGFDVIGPWPAARLEAASIFLLVHLAYLACVFWAKPDFEIKA